MKHTAEKILAEGVALLVDNPQLQTRTNCLNLWLAAVLTKTPVNQSINTTRIDIKKWPDGVHWYVFVNGESITVGNTTKWNTAQAAEDAAKEYLKGKTHET